jgi:hypothetical protein
LRAQNKYNLFLTFGSDFHRDNHNDWNHGDFWTQNPFVLPAFIARELSRYSDRIL